MTINLIEAVIALDKNARVSVNETTKQIVWHCGNQKNLSDEAIQTKLNELQSAEPMRVLREERNLKLAQTDWRASSDLTLSNEWSTYRQTLRDLPANSTPALDSDGNLQNVTWPDEPT